jgi:thioredoxin reductase (NADPH)
VATECKGDGDLLTAVRIKNVKTGKEEDLPVNGLFYAIGMFLSSLAHILSTIYT